MLHSWRDPLLARFAPKAARLILAADPDGLLFEEEVQRGIRKSGYDLLLFEDPVSFRFAYESNYRARWIAGEDACVVVVVRGPAALLNQLPFDVLRTGVQMSFDLSELFPCLHHKVVAALDRSELDRLYQAQSQSSPGNLNETATKDYILGHVFGLAPVTINDAPDLLRSLLQRHYRDRHIPKVLDDHILRVLRQKESFASWPLETIVPDRAAFFQFLQERWPEYLNSLATGAKPPVPFGHDLVHVYVEALFVEGLLQPIAWDGELPPEAEWARAGVKTDSLAEETRRWESLCAKAKEGMPRADAPFQQWLDFSPVWGQLQFVFCGKATPPATWLDVWKELRDEIDIRFSTWLISRYQGLHNQPALSPVMVQHVPRFLQHIAEDDGRKVALIVLDGMAWSQWVVLRGDLQARRPHWRIRENSVFAWIPTVTSVSRQALFAGSPPLYFPSSIFTTDREPALWSKFWADHGVPPAAVVYRKQLGETDDIEDLRSALMHPQVRVAGLVIETVDSVMHGMKLGATGMQNQVEIWAEKGYLTDLISLLLEQDFAVAITSDHGNVQAVGIGRPSEGALAQQRGQRARFYNDAVLRGMTKKAFPETIEWPGPGLPPQLYCLLSQGADAFVSAGETVVTHGGASFEEVVIPFIEVEETKV
jgi:hypothetical protein